MASGLRKLGLPAHKFLNYIEWLTLPPVLLWIVEQFNVLKQYFLVDVPAKQSSILRNKTLKDQWSNQTEDILAKIGFVAAVDNILTDFLGCCKRMNFNPCITLRMCVTSFDNNGKISTARGICQVSLKRVTWYQNCTL